MIPYISQAQLSLLFGAIQAIGVILVFLRVDVTIFDRLTGQDKEELSQSQLRRQQRLAKKTRREKIALILALGALSFSGYGFYQTMVTPEDPKTFANRVISWGLAPDIGQAFSSITANGNDLLSYKSNFKLGAVCYHYNGMGDSLDASSLQKSKLYDIKQGPIRVVIPLDSEFMDVWVKQQKVGTNYVLLLIPNTMDMSEFSNLRQAYALGIKQAWSGAGPP